MAIKSGHHFPRSFGFTGSVGDRVSVRGHERAKPVQRAAGGAVEVRRIAREEVQKHVAAKPPAGHGVKRKR